MYVLSELVFRVSRETLMEKTTAAVSFTVLNDPSRAKPTNRPTDWPGLQSSDSLALFLSGEIMLNLLKSLIFF